MPEMNERGMRKKTNEMKKDMVKPYPSKSKQKMEKSGNMSSGMAMGNGRMKKKEDKGRG